MADLFTFKQWSDAIFSNIGEILFGTPSAQAERAAVEMDRYFLEQIKGLRERPQGHLLGRLVATETEDGRLKDEELLSFCRLLLIAGNETTTGLITASARIFHEFPQTLDLIRSNTALIPTFIEEALRYYSPFSATVRRTSKEVTLAGVVIPEGDLVIPLIASANRDSRVFDQPEIFQIDRNPNPHLALGFGIHFCLGAHLARLEGKIVVECLAAQFGAITLADPQPDRGWRFGRPENDGCHSTPKIILVFPAPACRLSAHCRLAHNAFAEQRFDLCLVELEGLKHSLCMLAVRRAR